MSYVKLIKLTHYFGKTFGHLTEVKLITGFIFYLNFLVLNPLFITLSNQKETIFPSD